MPEPTGSEHLDPRGPNDNDHDDDHPNDRRRRTRGQSAVAKFEAYQWLIERLGLPIAIIVVLWIFILQPMAQDHFATNTLLRTNLETEAKTNLKQGIMLEHIEKSITEQADFARDTAISQERTAEILQQLLELQRRELPATRTAIEAHRGGPGGEK
jgi:hypothetical protein